MSRRLDPVLRLGGAEAKMSKRQEAAGEIKNFRQRLGGTQLELANQLETTPSTVSRWETGRSVPRTEYLMKMLLLAQEKGVEPPNLSELGRTDE